MKVLLPLIAIAAVALPIGAALSQGSAPVAVSEPAPERTWQLVQFYKGDAFVLDHGMTHDDCDDAVPRNQAAKGLRFSCELEG